VNFSGLGSVGWHLNRLRVETWDTTTNTYKIHNIFGAEYQRKFRSGMSAKFVNHNATVGSTQFGIMTYALFVSTKRILCRHSKYVDAREIHRKLCHKKVESVSVYSLGDMKTTTNPFKEYGIDNDNKFVPIYAIEINTPEELKTSKALGKFKPDAIKAEEVI